MQGQRSSMGSLPDTISFDHNPTPADNIDQPAFWNNNIQTNYAHNMVPEYINSADNAASTYLNPASQVQNLSGWTMGESSSSATQNYVMQNEQKAEDGTANALLGNGVDLNQSSGCLAYTSLFSQSASNNAFPRDLNIGAEVGENSGNHCQIMDCSTPENMRPPCSGSGGFNEDELYSSEGRRLSCKRKAIEGHIGQSSSSGSSSYFQPREDNDWHGWCNANLGSSTSTSLESPFQINARLGLTSSGNNSEIPFPSNVVPNVESSRRSHRTRVNPLPQPNSLPNLLPNNGNISGDSNVLSYPQSSRLVPLNNLSDVRTPQSTRWNRGSSSSRAGYSLSFGERNSRPGEETDLNNSLQRNISENPVFIPMNETRDSAQIPTSWGLTRGNTSGNLSIGGNASRNANSLSAPSGVPPQRNSRYSRRLSEYVRRSLLSSSIPETGGQNSNPPPPLQSGSSSQPGPSSGTSNREDRLSRLRSALMMERQLDSAFGRSESVRTMATGAEGRSRLVSEIRNVLDLMRRGEGLRLEDVVILDQSVFFGMADIHDRHRDMRLDVDNMSYEELLALEERIGNVSTGLSEETILKSLKQRKFFSIAMGTQAEVEPCCICREEYNDGEDIGTVECGHEFHSGCIKQWLMQKNLCPICKTAAVNK